MDKRIGFIHNSVKRRGEGSRKPVLLPALLLLALLASGCRYTAAPADLLQKPSIGAEQERLVAAIEKALPRYSKLLLPHVDEYKEAIRLLDLDGDGVQEAIVTYYNEYNAPEIIVMKSTENGWRQWLLLEQPIARDIAWLKLQDMDGDGRPELLVGWVGAIDNPNTLELYTFQSKAVRNEKGRLTLRPEESLPYHLAETGDLNGDGLPEIAVISATASSGEIELPRYYLTLYAWKVGSFAIKDTFQLPEGVHSFERMLLGNIAPDKRGLVLEGGTGAHSMLTYMYVWDERVLTLVYPQNAEGSEGFSGRPTASGDMNGDGIIELHLAREAPGQWDLPYAETMWINEWVQWDGQDRFQQKAEQYLDYTYNVAVDIPSEWQGRYTMKQPAKNSYGIVTFLYYARDGAVQAELATLYVVPNRQWHGVEAAWKEEGRPYRIMAEGSGNVFIVSFQQKAPSGLGEADQQAFMDMLGVEGNFGDYMAIRQE